MNKYEMGVILRADLEEEVFQAEMERVKGLIDRFGGVIDKVDEPGRRKLAYPIQKLTEGMYAFITYQSESSTPAQVEDRLKLMENVLRFLTIRKDEKENETEDVKPEEVKAEEVATEEVVTEEVAAEEVTAEERSDAVDSTEPSREESTSESKPTSDAVQAKENTNE